MKWFVRLGNAAVDLEDHDGHSPLHWAALGGYSYICQILIDQGVKPDKKDNSGYVMIECWNGICTVVLGPFVQSPITSFAEGTSSYKPCGFWGPLATPQFFPFIFLFCSLYVVANGINKVLVLS